MNFLASPPLVVAYAIAGTVDIDLTRDPIGHDPAGDAVYLRDIWPTALEIQQFIGRSVSAEMFSKSYANVFQGDERWRGIAVPESETYAWDGRQHLHPEPALLRRHGTQAAGPADRARRALPRAVRRLDHDRSHLAGGRHREGRARGPVPAGAGRRACRLQQLRLAPRQPRDHDARHLRQHAHQEPDGPRRRGRRDRATSRAASRCRSTTPP